MTSLQEVLDAFDPAKPFILTPWGFTSRFDLSQSTYSDERVAIVTTSRSLADHLNEKAGHRKVITTMQFLKHRATEWGLVVILGAKSVANFRTKTHKAICRARMAGAKVMCLSSYFPEPVQVFGAAKALGTHRELFGTYDRFVNEYFVVWQTHGCGPGWVQNVRPDRVEALAETSKRMVDFRLAEIAQANRSGESQNL